MTVLQAMRPPIEVFLSGLSGVAPGTKNILVFKTDVDSSKRLHALKSLLKTCSGIWHWSVDMEDADKVLRMEASPQVTADEIIALLNTQELHCRPLE